MKNEAIVNGVPITRAQAEAALKEMNVPDPIKPGDRFVLNTTEYVALDKAYAQRILSYAAGTDITLLLNLKSNELSYNKTDGLERYRKP